MGIKFHHLTLIESLEKRNNAGNRFYLCLCDCGKKVEICSSHFRCTKSCGCIRKIINEEKSNLRDINFVGKKIGLLTVKKNIGVNKKTRSIMYSCTCDCGNTVDVSYSSLNNKNKLSCGCLKDKWKCDFGLNQLGKLKHETVGWKGYKEISSSHFTRIKIGAKERNFEFSVTIEQVWDLFLKQDRKCALSGLELNFNSSNTLLDGNASLDRIDSSKGYTIDNIQWVHKQINEMKMAQSQKGFIEFCHTISNYQNGINIKSIEFII